MSTLGIIGGFVLLAAAGTLARVVVGRLLNGSWFPVGTFAVNTVGSFALGLLTASGWGGSAATTLVGVAALGSLTTFSTVAWETLSLAMADQKRRAGVYLGFTVLAGLAAALAGLELGG